MANTAIPIPEAEELRNEIAKLRKEMVDFRVERAAKHLEYMRNWMGYYTATATLVILGFGMIGWRGYSDIQANKDRVETTAAKATQLMNDVTNKFESIKEEDASFRRQIADNAKIVQQNKTILFGFRSNLDELERKHGELRKTEDQMTNELTGLSGRVRDLSADLSFTSKSLSTSLSSSLSLTTGIGDLVSSSLKLPVITSVSVLSDGRLSIQGNGFGAEGKVLISTVVMGAQVSNGQFQAVLSPSISSSPIPNSSSYEIPTILNWSDTSIVCGDVRKFYAQTFFEDFDTRKSIVGIQVKTGSGPFDIKSSNIYALFQAPSPPSSLSVTVQ